MTTPAPGPIALIGGEEFRPASAALDRALLGLARGDPPTVAIVPTAAVPENASLAAANGVEHFRRLGADAYAVMITDRGSADAPALVDELRRADLVYLTGGSPPYLLEALRGSRAWSALVELSQAGTVLAGSSAGAMAFCEHVLFASGPLAGLALVLGVAVLPHFERRTPDSIERIQASLPDDLTVLGIDGATGCVRVADGWRVEGAERVTLMTKTQAQVLGAGATFELPSAARG